MLIPGASPAEWTHLAGLFIFGGASVASTAVDFSLGGGDQIGSHRWCRDCQRHGARRLASAYVVEDRNGAPIAFVYFRDPGVARAANALGREVARRVAVNIAKLPKLLGAEGTGEG